MANKPKIDPQFSAEDAAIPVNAQPTELSAEELAALEARPPSQNDPEGGASVPPVPPVDTLQLYPGSAAKGTFVMPDGTVVRNC